MHPTMPCCFSTSFVHLRLLTTTIPFFTQSRTSPSSSDASISPTPFDISLKPKIAKYLGLIAYRCTGSINLPLTFAL